MARYTDPVCRLCRREGAKLFLKGARCYTKKCAFERRPRRPASTASGAARSATTASSCARSRRFAASTASSRSSSGTTSRRPSRNPGVTGENLLRLLELRLDNVVFRLGIAASRDQARQLVGHGHFAVNGRPTNIPSFQVKPGDTVEVRESHRDREPFKLAKETLRSAQVPEWLTIDPTTLTGTIAAVPRRDQMPLELNEQLVVEYYSR